jgi:hypothetical protein
MLADWEGIMALLNWQRELAREGHRVFFSGQPFAMHCHHYNINLQKTLEDTLGEQGIHLLFRSAEESSYQSFRNLVDQYPQIKTVKSKLEMAATVFQHYGLGVIHFQKISPSGGRIASPSSHHVTGWLAKHGRRETAGCHFNRGWIAGVLAAIYGQPLGHYLVEEQQCKMMRDPECIFRVETKKTQPG